LFYNVLKEEIHKLAGLKQQISQKMRLVHESDIRLCSIRQCCIDFVAGVDGALIVAFVADVMMTLRVAQCNIRLSDGQLRLITEQYYAS